MSDNLAPTPLEADIPEEVPLTIEVDSSEHASAERVHERQQHERHWTMLVVSTLVLVLSFTLGLRGSGSEASIEAWGLRMPSLCSSRSWFGVECPGCGLTRSFVALASGNWEDSLRFHRVGWLLFLAVVLQIPYRLFALRELRTGAASRGGSRAWPQWFGSFLLVALIGNWILNIVF